MSAVPAIALPAAPTVYRPATGARWRSFISAGDRDAYERGYTNWPDAPDCKYPCPEMTGWADRERQELNLDSWRAGR